MDQIVWHDNYNMGVDFIDKEHKQLFSTMNKLLRLSESVEKSEWVCREGTKYLKNHTQEHFEHEEEYMRSINYSEYQVHKRLHDDFRNITLPALEKEMEESGYSLESIRHFIGVCIGWMVGHTQTEDMAITGKKKSKWADLPHKEETEALEQAVIQLIDDIFHFNARMISEQYAGENFGEVVCCRFIYSGQKKEKWEITLVYEKHLLLKIISDILNTQYLRVDDMVINITRYISRQFLERIRENFPSVDLFKLEKESLLSYEQLVDSFERTTPACSLLFDTGNGYFAFCANSSESVRGKIVPNIDPANAMLAINEFLNREKPVKKNILVVDDSDFMRARIVKLLSKNYTVSEASSSVAAIQSIAVNRPDLIVLDYEMPVCDGRQVLEMIRMEKNTANIPVVFLTGKGDRESIQKVMALKPEGYLLKSLPDEEIKKYIDTFLAKKSGK
ncbi:MAG: response regulator [Acetatifactor sp.]|nr:response regulator [Acetatifactor sp.]